MAALKKGIGGGFARAMVLLVAMILAFGPPLDTAAHAASKAVEAGDTSIFLKVLSAFDVLDDPFDHLPGGLTSDKAQVVVQLALPELNEVPIGSVIAPSADPWPAPPSVWSSRLPPPLERPPRA